MRGKGSLLLVVFAVFDSEESARAAAAEIRELGFFAEYAASV